jgi:prophage DNA circulation protein
MTWREDLRRVSIDGKQLVGASFRGVPFLVESSERSGGRRVQVHEFPLRDDPFAEDLGRKARTFRIDGYVIGDDYLTKRDALQVALEDVAGPGELVDPFHGVKRAMCVGLTVRSTRAEGGIAMFAIEFTETPAQAPVPVEVVDGAEQVADHADVAITATSAELVEQYSVTGLPAFAIESAETAMTLLAEAMERLLAPAVTTAQELASLTGRVALLTAQVSSLVRAPGEIVGEIQAVITGLSDTIEAAPGAVLEALLEVYDVPLGAPVVATTATRERELANQIALVAGLRRVMAIEAARLAPLVPYVSIEEATVARDRVAAQLEEQAAGAEDTAYPALVNLRSGVLRAVPGDTAFARIVTVTRNVATPSLLLAYQLYGSVELELDIVERNNVRHPGFLAGELQVLSEG